jgi:hypothetical protein
MPSDIDAVKNGTEEAIISILNNSIEMRFGGIHEIIIL